MARFASSFRVFFLRQNHKDRNFNLRNITTVAGGGELIQKKDQIIPDIDKQEALKDVSKYLRNRPRWEQTLVSEFAGIDFSDSNVLHEIIKNQNNAMLKVRFFYWVTSQYGLPSDEHLYKLIFNSLVETKAASIALKFLEYTRFNPDSVSLEVFACCLSENRLIGDAVHVFDELIDRGDYPSLATWNLALTAAVRIGRTDVVWKLYGDMMNIGVVPDVETVSCLILALCREDKLSEGYDLLRQCLKDGNVPDNVAFAKLISRLSARKKYSGVSAVLHTMIVNDRLPNTDVYEEIIYWLCRQSNVREAYRIFNDLKDRGYAPNTNMYTAMIRGLCKLKQLEDARKFLCEMIEKGMKPTEHTYIVLTRELFEVGDVDSAQEIYKDMLSGGYKETTMSYNTMIIGLCLCGKIDLAWAMFEQMHQKGTEHDLVEKSTNFMIKEDLYIYQEIIHWLCKTNNMHDGFRIFSNLKDRGYAPNSFMYTTIIHNLCKMKQLGDARKLLCEMIEKEMKPEEQTYIFLITGLFSVGDVDGAQEIYKELLDMGYKETAMSYNKMITGLCLNGKIEVACDIFEQMHQKANDCALVKNTCNFMMRIFCKEGKVVECMMFLYRLLDQGFQPPLTSYTCLIEKLCETGEVQKAKKLWNDMQDKGVVITAPKRNSIIKRLEIMEVLT